MIKKKRKSCMSILLVYSNTAPVLLTSYLQILVANVQLPFICNTPLVFGITACAVVVLGVKDSTFFPPNPRKYQERLFRF